MEQYIGVTTTSVSRRLTMHSQNGGILKHFQQDHHCKPTRQQLTENTTILTHDNNKNKLMIKEALLILQHNPSINRQFDNFTNTLKLYSHRNHSNLNNPQPTIETYAI